MSTPQFDAQELMERVSDDRELLGQLIDMFASRSTELMAELRQQVDQPDAPQVTRTAHQLRGMLANMAGHHACRLAAALETRGRADNLAGLAQDVDVLDGAVSRLAADLQRFVAAQPSQRS